MGAAIGRSEPDIEYHAVQPGQLAQAIALHLCELQPKSRVFVTAAKPGALHSSVRRYWLALLRGIQRERSSTLNTERIRLLSEKSIYMQRLRMATVTAEKPLPQADIYFGPEQLLYSVVPAPVIYSTHSSDGEPSQKYAQITQKAELLVYYEES